MVFYKDSDRVKDALMPTLFKCLITMYLSHNPEIADDLEPKIKILNTEIEIAFTGLSMKRQMQLERRVIRTCKRIDIYFKKEQFDSRKCFLTLMGWIESLIRESRKLRQLPENKGNKIEIIKISHNFRLLLKSMYRIIIQGYAEIENFEKIDLSAINHITALHNIAQEDGYF